MDKLRWKRNLSQYYPALHQQNRKVILLYHAIGNSPWAVSKEDFCNQISWLKENCTLSSLTELLNSKSKNKKIEVAITFDDGYACLYHTVLPILKEKAITATVYLSTSCMGNTESGRVCSNPMLGHYPDEKFLTWDEVSILEQNNWEIGSHGVTHADLTKADSQSIISELTQSKKEIENKLNKTCEHFAYTFAKHNDLVRRHVIESGYQYAVAGQHTKLKKKI